MTAVSRLCCIKLDVVFVHGIWTMNSLIVIQLIGKELVLQ